MLDLPLGFPSHAQHVAQKLCLCSPETVSVFSCTLWLLSSSYLNEYQWGWPEAKKGPNMPKTLDFLILRVAGV